MCAVLAGIILGGIVGAQVGSVYTVGFPKGSWFPFLDYLDYIVVGALVGASIGGSLIYFSKAAIESGYTKEKVLIVVVIVIVVLAGAGIAVYARIESTIPKIQDFPGLQQELVDLKNRLYPEQYWDIVFEGYRGNKTTITGGFVRDDDDMTSDCRLLTNSALKYISEEYHLTVGVLRSGDMNYPFPYARNCP